MMSQELCPAMKESAKGEITKMSSAENCAPPSKRQPLPFNCSLPHIPWQIRSQGIITEFSQSLIAEIINRHDTTNEKQNLFLALSKSIPFFLPASYHQMKCKKPINSLPSMEFLDMKQLWDDAFNLIYVCNEFDHTYMAKIFDRIEKLGTNFCTQLEAGAHGQYSPLQENNDNQTAAEFLMEPWILLQIPFQPALLHQWAVAVLAEALKFEKEISILYAFGLPKKLEMIAKNLRKMLLDMRSCANFALQMYLMMSAKGDEFNIHTTLYTEMEEFSNHITKVLPILAFVTRKEATSAIAVTIEKICVQELIEGGEVSAPQVAISDADVQPTPIYDYWFWTKKCDLQEVFTGALGDRGICNSELQRQGPVNAHYLGNAGNEEEVLLAILGLVKNVAINQIINAGRMKGIDPEIIMAAVDKFAPYLTNTYCFIMMQYCETFAAAPAVRSDGHKNKQEIYGAISDIIFLYFDVKFSEIFHLMTGHIVAQIATKETFIGIQTCCPTEKQQLEAAILEIDSTLKEILTNQEWTWDKILADAKYSCGLSDGRGVSDIGLHAANLAQHFQHRIKSLVFKIAKRHLTTLKAGRFEFVPEHQFVQYVLPCFVAHFLTLCENPSVNLTSKQRFVRFVDKLIFSYEQQEYVQHLSTETKAPIQNQRDAKICCANLPTFFLHFGKFINQEDAVKDIIFIFDCSLVKFMHGSNTANGLLIEGGPVKHSKWFIQIDMFLKRTISTLEDLNDIDQNKLLSITTYVERVISNSEKNVIAVSNLYIQSMLKAGGKNMSSGITAIRKINAELGVGVPEDMLKSAHHLSCQQLAGLFVFLHFGNLEAPQYSQWKNKFQGPGFPLDLCSVLIWCVATNDRWKIKQIVGPLLTTNCRRGKQSRDPSLVSYDFVKSNKCYKQVLKMISPDGSRVQMKHPGEITFVPIKHCRWCGLIKVEKFRLCPECFECPKYCDVNYFCSEDCETVALDSKHREEHARYFMVKLGIDRDF